MIDEIYDLFIWDAAMMPEEYEARVDQGLALAEQVRYLHPFLQPIVPGHSKSVWEPCARVLAARSDEALEPYQYQLFEWLRDMTWPGAELIRDRLLKIPFARLEDSWKLSVTIARREEDEGWLEVLKDFKKEAQK